MSDRVLREVERVLRDLPKGKLCLAVSGGLDSMVLLAAVAKLRSAKDLCVLHVNHGLRGKESDQDETLVKRESERLGAAFFSTRLTWKGEKSSQEACRKKRESFFSTFEGPILLAHHRDDQAETVFLRILRGTGFDGLCGMKEVDGKKIRPLLSLPKEVLHKTAIRWRLQWREDSSNLSAKYERNWLRLEVFPMLEKRRPRLREKLAALATEAQAKQEPKHALTGFKGEGFECWWLSDLRALSALDLKRTFAIPRKHVSLLVELIEKGNGSLTAPGKNFHLSADVLWIEKGSPLAMNLVSDGRVFSSILGKWTIKTTVGLVGKKSDFSLGERGKKEFQAQGIPIFFRESIPILKREKNIFSLTPERLKKISEIAYEPSALGEWLFISLRSRSDLAASISKEKIRPQ